MYLSSHSSFWYRFKYLNKQHWIDAFVKTNRFIHWKPILKLLKYRSLRFRLSDTHNLCEMKFVGNKWSQIWISIINSLSKQKNSYHGPAGLRCITESILFCKKWCVRMRLPNTLILSVYNLIWIDLLSLLTNLVILIHLSFYKQFINFYKGTKDSSNLIKFKI